MKYGNLNIIKKISAENVKYLVSNQFSSLVYVIRIYINFKQKFNLRTDFKHARSHQYNESLDYILDIGQQIEQVDNHGCQSWNNE